MPRKLILTAFAGLALAIGVAAIAVASHTPYVATCLRSSSIAEEGGCPGFPSLVPSFGAAVVPKELPSGELVPVALRLWGNVSTSDGTHPSALREATIDFDRNLVISAKGLPVCGRQPHFDTLGAEESILKACRDSIVGGGKADFEIAFPELPPIREASKLTAYNAGVKGGVTTLFVVAAITTPAPRPIVMQVEIEKIHKGRYGQRAVAKIPVIAGGSGSLLDFRLETKRLFRSKGMRESFAMASCRDDHLATETIALFRNEAGTPGIASTTLIKGTVAIPCLPKD